MATSTDIHVLRDLPRCSPPPVRLPTQHIPSHFLTNRERSSSNPNMDTNGHTLIPTPYRTTIHRSIIFTNRSPNHLAHRVNAHRPCRLRKTYKISHTLPPDLLFDNTRCKRLNRGLRSITINVRMWFVFDWRASSFCCKLWTSSRSWSGLKDSKVRPMCHLIWMNGSCPEDRSSLDEDVEGDLVLK